MGQMVRGGRSWPSDRNVAAGAPNSGKSVEACASGTTCKARVDGGADPRQHIEHMLHLSCAGCPCPPLAWSWPAAIPSTCTWWCMPWRTCCSLCDVVLVDVQAMVAAAASRSGSSVARSTSSQMRNSFTAEGKGRLSSVESRQAGHHKGSHSDKVKVGASSEQGCLPSSTGAFAMAKAWRPTDRIAGRDHPRCR